MDANKIDHVTVRRIVRVYDRSGLKNMATYACYKKRKHQRPQSGPRHKRHHVDSVQLLRARPSTRTEVRKPTLMYIQTRCQKVRGGPSLSSLILYTRTHSSSARVSKTMRGTRLL
jgi:hypothetical protein